MKKVEATNLLCEIVYACKELNHQAIVRMPPNSADVLSGGYQLHIKRWSTHVSNYTQLKAIAMRNGYSISVSFSSDLLVIYKPMSEKKIKNLCMH